MTSLAAVQKTPDPVIVSLPDAPVLSLEEFRSKDQRDALPARFQLRKAYECDEVKQVGGEESRRVRYVISTKKRDRHRDTIDPEGWELENYHRGGPGPVLWAHSHFTPSLGGGTAEVKGKRLVAEVDFAPAEIHPFADMVFQLVKGDYGLKGASVGFMPFEHVYNDQEAGYDFKKQELLEFSVVNVGSNPDALRKAAADGIDVQPAIIEALKVLDGIHESEGLWIPKAKALAVVKALGYGSGVKFFDLGTADIREKVKRKVGGEVLAVKGAVGDGAAAIALESLDNPGVFELSVDTSAATEAIGDIADEIVEDLSKLLKPDTVELSDEQLDTIAARIAEHLKTPPSETIEQAEPEKSEPVLLVEADTTPKYSIDLSQARAVLHELLEPKAEEIKRQFTRVTGQVIP